MLDEKDLLALSKLIDEKISASEERMTEKIAASEENMFHKVQPFPTPATK